MKSDAKVRTAICPALEGAIQMNDFSNQTSEYFGDRNAALDNLEELPRILFAILVKDAEKCLPLFLECLLKQTYDRKRIGLYIRSNDNSDNTDEILSRFISEWGETFAEISYSNASIDSRLIQAKTHDWYPDRFRVMARIRQESITFAKDRNYDFYFNADHDVFLLEDSLEALVKKNVSVIAPMLTIALPEVATNKYENAAYSNFYFADEGLWFVSRPEYYEMVKRQKVGIHEVDVIHLAYLIRSDVLPIVNFGYQDGDWEYKNLVRSLRASGIPLLLDNSRCFGVVTHSDQVEISRVMLDLQRKENQEKWETKNQKTFNGIYANYAWGYLSGPGSIPENAKPYIEIVNELVEKHSVNSILDLGCGDFRIGRNFVLREGGSYLGVDVVEALINELREKFNSEIRKFLVADIEEFQWDRQWDLVVVKDVLQHLPNSSVQAIVTEILKHCKLAVFCNDFEEGNRDIVAGDCRGLNLVSSPFNFDLRELLRFGGKQVLLYERK